MLDYITDLIFNLTATLQQLLKKEKEKKEAFVSYKKITKNNYVVIQLYFVNVLKNSKKYNNNNTSLSVM